MACAHSIARLLKNSRIRMLVSKRDFAALGLRFVVVIAGACVRLQIAALLLPSVLMINFAVSRARGSA